MAGKTKSEQFGDQSEQLLIEKVVNGTITRNKNFDFFRSTRGRTIFKKAKIIKGLMNDVKKGGVVVDEKECEENMLIVIENGREKYKNTIFLDKIMYEVYKRLEVL